MDAYDITASALTAQRFRLNVISSNLANVNTTRKEDGSLGAYRRKNLVFAPLMDPQTSETTAGAGGVSMGPDGRPMLQAQVSNNVFQGVGVQVMNVVEDEKTPMRMLYDPSHPDANEQGYVEMPNINPVTEMVDMISASRAYEANVTALQSAKQMSHAALEI